MKQVCNKQHHLSLSMLRLQQLMLFSTSRAPAKDMQPLHWLTALITYCFAASHRLVPFHAVVCLLLTPADVVNAMQHIIMPWLHAPIYSSEVLTDVTELFEVKKITRPRKSDASANVSFGWSKIGLKCSVLDEGSLEPKGVASWDFATWRTSKLWHLTRL